VNLFGNQIFGVDQIRLVLALVQPLQDVIDLVYEIISESDPQWADFDANEDSRKRHMYQAKHSKNAEIVEAPVVMSQISDTR
jgi:hypothetical protein